MFKLYKHLIRLKHPLEFVHRALAGQPMSAAVNLLPKGLPSSSAVAAAASMPRLLAQQVVMVQPQLVKVLEVGEGTRWKMKGHECRACDHILPMIEAWEGRMAWAS